MDFSKEYDELYSSFTRERNLDLDDNTWPEKDYNDFTDAYNKLFAKWSTEQKKKASAAADEEYDEDFYLIDVTIDTLEGPDYEVIDVRKMPLEDLSKLCRMFPRYYEYYFKKLKESL